MFLLKLLALFLALRHSHAFIEGLYCGKQNCYDVLGVQRNVAKLELSRAYRQLAAKYHPDRYRTNEAKEQAAEKFTTVATAYEVLKDEDSRRDYDYMLDNPDEIYRHYFSYYQHRMTPKVDPRIVIAVTITVISIVQYWGAWNRYKTAIDYIVTVPKYRMQAQEIAKKEGLVGGPKKRDKRSKEVIKEEEEQIFKNIIAEKMDIRGGYSRPSICDILWLQLILLPYTMSRYVWWNLRWLWKFNIKGQPYEDEEKLYIIRKRLKVSQAQFDAMPDEETADMMRQELWIAEKFQVWKEKKELEMKAKLAESARYKSYRRYMKNHGPGQISFDD